MHKGDIVRLGKVTFKVLDIQSTKTTGKNNNEQENNANKTISDKDDEEDNNAEVIGSNQNHIEGDDNTHIMACDRM